MTTTTTTTTTTSSSSTVGDRARIVWSMRLRSAIRAALACAIVGATVLYGPTFFTNKIKFPSFSYLTAMLIISDASLGDTLKGFWHAFCATVQVVPLSVLWWWIIGLVTDQSVPNLAIMVGTVTVASFVVAMLQFTHLTAKKIAFGQIVLVCTAAVVKSESGDRLFMQPLYIAASTALGAFASVIAWLVPYPDLGTHKEGELCRIYAENKTQRMSIYLRAFTATDQHTKMELISQAKPLSETGAKLLKTITILQEGMQWERPWRRVSPGHRLERMELQFRGIEYSLLSSPPPPVFPLQTTHQHQLSSDLLETLSARLEEKIRRQVSSCSTPSNSTTTRENPSLPLDSPTFPINKQRWIFFYFSCIDMILNDHTDHTSPNEQLHTHSSKTWIQQLTSHERLIFSIKCSLSLSLAVLCGLLYDKENACWAGLAIAISIVTGRQAIFTTANARAQGTAIGSVYGVICCFLFSNEGVRLLAILPWIVVISFVRYSKMYGQTVGIAASIGALLILGRKNYGVPHLFAIARLTEVFIGLSSFIVVELFMQPRRATTLAKNHLLITLNTLQDYIKETAGVSLLQINKSSMPEKQRRLDSLICELKELVTDAELEPDFWYLPFRTCCYQKMVQSVSNIRDLLHFITYNSGIVSELLETSALREEFREQINDELELLQETVKQAIPTQQHIDGSRLEEGVLQNKRNLVSFFITQEKETEWTKLQDDEDSEENNKLREMIRRHMSATGFCITSLLKELKDIEICLQEINQCEN